LPVKSVIVTRKVVNSVLTYSKAAHPREGILLLRGSSKKGVLRIESVAVPPMATHGQGFSSFNWYMVPVDLSFVGVAHSHPSGHAVPSHQDMIHMMGKVMMIAGFPYEDLESLKIYDAHGNSIPYQVDESSSGSGDSQEEEDGP
jgi:proteasome lid subunit RPN8/RPN11